jgi:hypothetical protein
MATRAGSKRARRAQQAGAIALARSEQGWAEAATLAAFVLRAEGRAESVWAGLGELGVALYTITAGCTEDAAA